MIDNNMSLHNKIVVFQWVLGFLGAWAIMVSVSSMKEDTSTLSPVEVVQAKQVDTIEILKDKESLTTLKPLKQP